tara:strand:+ start:1465 stop:2409 length:945 start_codon:yes stop_codon:yes gene_type:complete
MLSKTADHLFWMARYTERAENTARMLDVNIQTELLPHNSDSIDSPWKGILSISDLEKDFNQKYKNISKKDLLDYMVCDFDNPSSIASCLTKARENARSVRETLTTEVWETHNITWLDMNKLIKKSTVKKNPSEFFEWVKHRSHLSRGVITGTMLKDESFFFIRLGTFLERADNTARLLDVKFHDLNYKTFKSDDMDFYYWGSVLRSVSAFEIYRKAYRDLITPARVAELLILRNDMPRSLISCMKEVLNNLEFVRNDISSETERYAGRMYAELKYSSVQDIFRIGLHNYLTKFLSQAFELGGKISRDFLVPVIA